MSDKVEVGLVYGGRSGEHEVSVRSARSVADALDRQRFSLTPIAVGRDGGWQCIEGQIPADAAVADGQGVEVVPTRGPRGCRLIGRDGSVVAQPQVLFPVLHGPYGEDGTFQGFCEVLGVPYVGAGVLGSAIAMDKDIQKRLMRDAGIPIVPFETVLESEWSSAGDAVAKRLWSLGEQLFVKPANLGSSVGISKVREASELEGAMREAFRHDRKAVVEKAVDAREIECAVLGNDQPRASLPGEIAPGEEFYSYEDKYAANSSAELLIPAPLDAEQTERVRELAVRVFRALELRGMARVDFFIERANGEIYLNEPNTLPGFTSISMYPKMWEATGLPYRDLISELIDLALQAAAR